MKFSTLALVLSIIIVAVPSYAALIPVAGYSHSGSDGGFYVDSTGNELTDGIDANIAWGPGVSIGPGDILPLVGWQNNNPTIQFNFAATVNIGALEVWFADSNGSAGVAMPSAVTLSTSGGYSQNFPVVDPLGYGATVPVTISGLNISTDNLTLTVTRSQQWTMLSEVRFFERTVPEPTGLVLIAAMLSSAALRRSR
jgi:hypothetical protein